MRYNAALAITEAIKGSSREKLYQELGLEYLYRGSWARRLCLLYKVLSTGQPSYIYDPLPPCRHVSSFKLVNLNISRTLSFLMPFMNRINQALTFAVPLRLTYFAIHY